MSSSPATNRRLLKELQQLREGIGGVGEFFTDVTVDESNLHRLTGLLLPAAAPFDRHAYRVELVFPADYPFKPPLVTFISRIFHPNVEEAGKMCFAMIAPDSWRPATKIEQVLHELKRRVEQPDCANPQRDAAAKLYLTDRDAFDRLARDNSDKFAEPRPTPATANK